jgi:GDP-mannose 6-dehydrogenase
VKIAVFGLGYVGTVTAGCLAGMGHEIIGVEVNPIKVDMINSGKSPVIEPGINDIIAEQWQKNQIKAVSEAEESVLHSDVSMVCVGTPSRTDGSLDLSYVKKVCREIGLVLPRVKNYHTVVIRSTLLPGMTEEEVIPFLEKHSGLQAGQDFGVCYNPEFLREGSAIYDFNNPPFLILGEYDQQGARVAENLYKSINSKSFLIPLRTAEMIKFTCNAFHALKVVFANEIGNICKKEGVDSHSVMDIFCQDKDLNLSSNYLRPGFSFGGSCLPKDLRALLYHSHHQGLNLPVLEAILPSNKNQIKIGVDLVKKTKKKKVGLIGISFKPETNDLRESPYVELAKTLLDQECQVQWFDENVSFHHLLGANKTYIEKTIPQFSSLRCDSIEELLMNCEVIIIGGVNDSIRDIVQKAHKGQHIIDLMRVIMAPEGLKAKYQGISW